MPEIGSMPQKEQQQESIPASQGPANRVNLQPYKTSRGSVSQRKMKFLTGGQSTAQTFTTMRLRGIQ